MQFMQLIYHEIIPRTISQISSNLVIGTDLYNVISTFNLVDRPIVKTVYSSNLNFHFIVFFCFGL